MKLTRVLVAVFGLLIASSQAHAGGVEVFKKQEGPWKAVCYKDDRSENPYCRIMVIYILDAGEKSGKFIQFGQAFDSGNTGFVFASYNGFAPESTVKVKIDSHEKHVLKTSSENHTISPAVMGQEIFEQLKNGKALTVDFKLSSGMKRALDYSLEGFNKLYPEVEKVIKGEK